MPPLSDPLYDETKVKLERLERRLNDVQAFQVPRLRNHAGTVVLQQQYAAETREDLESCRRELQILETFVDDIVLADRRKEVYDQLDLLMPKVEDLRKEFRAALLESKRNIDTQAPSHREELLRSSALQSKGSSGSQRGNNSDDAVMHASEAVTDALRQTTQLMQQELERSVLSTQILEESTRTMTTTSDIYTAFGTLLTTSKNLVTALEKADWLDRLLILSSLTFFLLVVAYIIKKRVIDKGLWLAFWWVKYLPLPSPRSTPPPNSPQSHTTVGVGDFVASLSSLAATSVISVIPSSALRGSVAEEISSLASAAFEFESSEPSDISILASSIIEEVLSRTTDHDTTPNRGAKEIGVPRIDVGEDMLPIDMDAFADTVHAVDRQAHLSLHEEL